MPATSPASLSSPHLATSCLTAFKLFLSSFSMSVAMPANMPATSAASLSIPHLAQAHPDSATRSLGRTAPSQGGAQRREEVWEPSSVGSRQRSQLHKKNLFSNNIDLLVEVGSK